MFIKKAKDPDFWRRVREEAAFADLRRECLDIWDHIASKPMPELKLSDYLRFFSDGNREAYETLYFARRRALCAVTMLALLYPEEDTYLRRLEDIIFAIAQEYTWCFAAHQVWDGREMDEVRIDLFAAETGWALSECDALLGDRLQPFVRAMIRREVERRILFSFLKKNVPCAWEAYINNWAAVCAGSVSAAFLYLRPDLYPEAKVRLDACMERFVGGYGDDGFCAEGIGYWIYGFGFYAAWADLVRDFTGEDHFRQAKVKASAGYLQKIYLNGNTTVSFADGSRQNDVPGYLNDFLRAEYGGEIDHLAPAAKECCDHCGRFCLFMRAAVWRDEDRLCDEKAVPDMPAVTYAPDVQWYIRKTAAWGFAAKAGHNEEFHNHCDVGSFIVAKGGRQIFCDVGAPAYDRDYFRGETRYSYFHSSSRGHCLPYFAEQARRPDESGLQKVGRCHAARDVKAEKGRFSMDIAGAYGRDDVHAVRRCFEVCDNCITLSDRFDTEENVPVAERFVLLAKPELFDGGFTVDGLNCRFGAPVSSVNIYEETISVHDSLDHETVWVLDAVPAENTFVLSIHL